MVLEVELLRVSDAKEREQRFTCLISSITLWFEYGGVCHQLLTVLRFGVPQRNTTTMIKKLFIATGVVGSIAIGATAMLWFVESDYYDQMRGYTYTASSSASSTPEVIEVSDFDRLDELEERETQLQTELSEVSAEIEAIYANKEAQLEARKEQRRERELSLL